MELVGSPAQITLRHEKSGTSFVHLDSVLCALELLCYIYNTETYEGNRLLFKGIKNLTCFKFFTKKNSERADLS